MEGQDKNQDANQPFKDESSAHNYQKLKRKYKALRDEYLRVLENWEDTQKTVKGLSKERKFLREKLDCFLKCQHFNVSDEQLTAAILNKNNELPVNSSPYGSTSNQKVTNLQANQLPTGQPPAKRIKKDHHSSSHPPPMQHQTFATQNMSSKGHLGGQQQMMAPTNQGMPAGIMMGQPNGMAQQPQQPQQQQQLQQQAQMNLSGNQQQQQVPPMQMMMEVQNRQAPTPNTYQMGMQMGHQKPGSINEIGAQNQMGTYKPPHGVQHS